MSKIDPAIYKLAGNLQETVRAEAIIESKEDPDAWGDGRQARGLYQIHPAFWLEYAPFAGITVSDTWEEADTKVIAAYYRIRASFPFDLVIQAYNQGWHGVFGQGKRAPIYLEDFFKAQNWIRGEKT